MKGLFVVALFLATQVGYQGGEWRKKFGQPELERYVIHPGIQLTVYFARDGRTCKLTLETRGQDGRPNQPRTRLSREQLEEMLEGIIPSQERGRFSGSIGMGKTRWGMSSLRYERVTVSYLTESDASDKDGRDVSATVLWKDVPCPKFD